MDGEKLRISAVPTANLLEPTIFHESWYLEAATGGNHRDVTVLCSGCVVGRLPYVLTALPAGQRLCSMPPLAHFLGPAIDPGEGSAVNQSLSRDRILRELIGKLPRTSGFYQKLHRGTTDTLVFQEHGFRTDIQFSYDIRPAPRAALWSAMRDKTRNVIRRAEETYAVEESHDCDGFLSFYNANLAERGRINHYRRIAQVSAAALLRERGRILAARDKSGRLVASIFYIWDASAAYYLLSTRRLDSGNGAVSLLIWTAMQDAASRGVVFDFDGVLNAGSRIFYSGFGGTIVPRYIVFRYSLLHRVVDRLGHSRTPQYLAAG
jgi:hypothetical protein